MKRYTHNPYLQGNARSNNNNNNNNNSSQETSQKSTPRSDHHNNIAPIESNPSLPSPTIMSLPTYNIFDGLSTYYTVAPPSSNTLARESPPFDSYYSSSSSSSISRSAIFAEYNNGQNGCNHLQRDQHERSSGSSWWPALPPPSYSCGFASKESHNSQAMSRRDSCASFTRMLMNSMDILLTTSTSSSASSSMEDFAPMNMKIDSWRMLSGKEKSATTLASIFNASPYVASGASKFNLHHSVLVKEGLLFVPYPRKKSAIAFQLLNTTANSSNNNNNNNEESVAAPANPDENNNTTSSRFFIGRLPLLVDEFMIQFLVRVVANVVPIEIRVAPAAKNVKGNFASPIAFVTVHRQDEMRLVANLHKRVIFDQCGLFVALNDEQTLALHRYCTMLDKTNFRFRHRPNNSILVTRCNPPVTTMPSPVPHSSPVHNNEYSPLCSCESCVSLRRDNTDYSFVARSYVAEEIGAIGVDDGDHENDNNEEREKDDHHQQDDENDDDAKFAVPPPSSSVSASAPGRPFRLYSLVKTHAFRKIENDPSATCLEKMLYVHVPVKCVPKINSAALASWPMFKDGTAAVEEDHSCSRSH